MSGFLAQLEGAERSLDAQRKVFSLRAALGLVCSAWDLQLNRPEATLFTSCLACPDPSVKLSVGKCDFQGDFKVSNEWPWKKSSEGLLLADVALAGWGGAVFVPIHDYVRLWNEPQYHPRNLGATLNSLGRS